MPRTLTTPKPYKTIVRQQIGTYQVLIRRDANGIPDPHETRLVVRIHEVRDDNETVEEIVVSRRYDELPTALRTALRNFHTELESVVAAAMDPGTDTGDFQ